MKYKPSCYELQCFCSVLMDLIQGVDRLYVQGQAYCAKHLFFTKKRKKKNEKKNEITHVKLMDVQRYDAEDLSVAAAVVVISGSLRVPWRARLWSSNPHTSGLRLFDSTILCPALPFSQAGFQ